MQKLDQISDKIGAEGTSTRDHISSTASTQYVTAPLNFNEPQPDVVAEIRKMSESMQRNMSPAPVAPNTELLSEVRRVAASISAIKNQQDALGTQFLQVRETTAATDFFSPADHELEGLKTSIADVTTHVTNVSYSVTQLATAQDLKTLYDKVASFDQSFSDLKASVAHARQFAPSPQAIIPSALHAPMSQVFSQPQATFSQSQQRAPSQPVMVLANGILSPRHWNTAEHTDHLDPSHAHILASMAPYRFPSDTEKGAHGELLDLIHCVCRTVRDLRTNGLRDRYTDQISSAIKSSLPAGKLNIPMEFFKAIYDYKEQDFAEVHVAVVNFDTAKTRLRAHQLLIRAREDDWASSWKIFAEQAEGKAPIHNHFFSASSLGGLKPTLKSVLNF